MNEQIKQLWVQAAEKTKGEEHMTDRELLQQALDALYENTSYSMHGDPLTYQDQRNDDTIKELQAKLAQPEPAECDGGQCGIGGYCKQCPKPLVKLKEMLEVQGRDGTWNYDHYFHGMYNGMEVMLAVLEGREPVFREAPKKWLSKKEWVGLTHEEHMEIMTGTMTTSSRMAAVEAKLKEKNT
jgi:hypothetical protein